MAENHEGFLARELLTGTFQNLKDKLHGKEVKLPAMARAEIANDSDWHRTRVGYTGYESAVLLRIGDDDGNNDWAIAFGTKCGNYPADPYDCDIAAVQLSGDGKSEEEVVAEVYDALKNNRYFCNSLIYAMADGRLAVSKKDDRFGQKVLELLGSRVEDFIAQDLEIDPNLFTMDLHPLVTSPVRYKKEFVAFLSETLQAVLTVNSTVNTRC